uniref:tyrosine-type recombinase/integrase n=1 Tax=Altererythrobacter segetis TaxID=1104773 RepID=UPI00140C98C9|nr:site-specific integrase [Altererythrobacter segetis]
MPRKLSNALTPMAVKNAKPGRHADGGGLHLLVKETGARSWVYRFMLRGKSRDIGLGAAGSGGISLADARDLASALRLKVKAGIDPLEERQREAAGAVAAAQAAEIAGITFKAVAKAYIAANEASWRNDKHRQQWRNTLASYVYPVMGDLPVAEISTSHVLQILEPIWQDKPETASRIRGRIETVLDAAKARGYREGENPARWRGHIAQILPARSRLTRGHHKAMPYAAIPAFVDALRARDATAARALEFAILTATRTSEMLGATWAEVDLDKAIWTIPAARMKAGKEHRVPLSPRAVEILENVKPLSKASLFPADKGGKLSTMAMSMLLRRMKLDCTVHGFRSGFRDWAAECTAYAHEVCEMALAHVIGNKSEAAYRRGDMFDKRRRLMTDWATYCASGVAAGANVSPIRGAVA